MQDVRKRSDAVMSCADPTTSLGVIHTRLQAKKQHLDLGPVHVPEGVETQPLFENRESTSVPRRSEFPLSDALLSAMPASQPFSTDCQNVDEPTSSLMNPAPSSSPTNGRPPCDSHHTSKLRKLVPDKAELEKLVKDPKITSKHTSKISAAVLRQPLRLN